MKRPFTASGRFFLIITAGLALTTLFTSCKKEQKNYDVNSIELTLNQPEEPESQSATQKWHITNKRILVLFGYDFNTPDIVL